MPATRHSHPSTAQPQCLAAGMADHRVQSAVQHGGLPPYKIVAGLGTSAVAAVTTGHRVFFLVQAILMGVSVAATALIARSWGAGQVRQAELVNWTSMLVSLGIAALLSLPIVFAPESIAGLFGLDRETTLAAAGFIFWLGVFNLASAANLILSTGLRATGDVITPGSCSSVPCSISASPIPSLSVSGRSPVRGSGRGAGWQFRGMLIALIFCRPVVAGAISISSDQAGAHRLGYRKTTPHHRYPGHARAGPGTAGFPGFLRYRRQLWQQRLRRLRHRISLVSFSIVVGFGFGIAAATLVGQQLGASRPDLALAAGWRSLRLSC